MSLSDKYKKTLTVMHATEDWGTSGKSWAPTIQGRVVAGRCETMLDYGCGQGTLKAAMFDRIPTLVVAEFDPGIVGKDGKPGPADIVTATDVLEHVEPKELNRTLRQIRDLSRKECFLMIACTPARAILPTGQNAHLIIERPPWWLDRLGKVFVGWPTIIHEPVYRKSKRLVVSLIRPLP